MGTFQRIAFQHIAFQRIAFQRIAFQRIFELPVVTLKTFAVSLKK
jgi:hypothetical protein